ncbi:hypothetical protein A0H81_14141 [Grifola frondosa]|uniref:Uncharacterized protein n=1 Tax=Grifola frondosa TaxID=5627 RepID=A0A1C7LN18_GRIFR|nr:hypothetical protein A0H81_14141 [Grifola frondosa]
MASSSSYEHQLDASRLPCGRVRAGGHQGFPGCTIANGAGFVAASGSARLSTTSISHRNLCAASPATYPPSAKGNRPCAVHPLQTGIPDAINPTSAARRAADEELKGGVWVTHQPVLGIYRD